MRKIFKNFIKKYYFEVIVLLLIILGLFLLIEDFDLKLFIQSIFSKSYFLLKNSYNFLLGSFSGGLKLIKLSNLLGFIILFFSFILVLRRWKNRILSNSISSKECIKCESLSNRVKTSFKSKALEFIFRLKIRKYQCGKCNFSYLLVKKKQTKS
jgi:hypothetical protein